ncbi:MAG: DUF6151 family protein [Sedimentitalea sp.]
MSDHGFSCTCGTLRGTISGAGIKSGTHLICHCRDCRAGELFLGQSDPGQNGVAMVQTMPDAVTLTQGADKLGLLRLSKKGPYRWFATCCNAPLFNTLSSAKLPFASLSAARLDDPARLGPVRVRAFVPQPGGGTKHKGAAIMAWRLFTNMGSARLSGRWKSTPFFDDSGAPVAKAVMPDKAERAAFYP